MCESRVGVEASSWKVVRRCKGEGDEVSRRRRGASWVSGPVRAWSVSASHGIIDSPPRAARTSPLPALCNPLPQHFRQPLPDPAIMLILETRQEALLDAFARRLGQRVERRLDRRAREGGEEGRRMAVGAARKGVECLPSEEDESEDAGLVYRAERLSGDASTHVPSQPTSIGYAATPCPINASP